MENQWDKRADLPLPNHPQYQVLYELTLDWKRLTAQIIAKRWEEFDKIFDHILNVPTAKAHDFFQFAQLYGN